MFLGINLTSNLLRAQIFTHIEDLPNIYLMFSLDSSEASKKRKEEVERLDHPQVYYSFLRQSMNEDTMGASIIFNLQQNKKQLKYDDRKRTCPVDAGVMPIHGACNKCRKCFSPGVYK